MAKQSYKGSQYQTDIDAMKSIISEAEKQRAIQIQLGEFAKAQVEQEKIVLAQLQLQVEQEKLKKALKEGTIKLNSKEKDELEDVLKTEKKITTELTKQEKRQKDINAAINEFTRQVKLGWQYLMESDKAIKSTILNLGMSGAKAAEMRSSFEQSAGFAARLGATLADISKIQEGFADETGKARVLSAQMVDDIVAMGKGTGLGIEQATKLAAQFEFMGVDAKNAMTFVQGVVDTSERMGINTTKVLKTVIENFRKLSTFSFKNGVKSFGEMAMSAERTRVDMATALNVAEAKRSLSSVIELAANLQVMGGKFAEMDPFQWLYMVRNEPEKLNEQLSKMTEGMFTLKKNSDGVFERFISPADVDRLTKVADSLGIAKERMFEIAQKRLDLTNLDKAMAGSGFNKKEKDAIKGAAILNQTTGKYQVTLAGVATDILSLTEGQAKAFVQEQTTLEERAKQAQTFEEALKATINELKSGLLPMLRAVNATIAWLRPIVAPFVKAVLSGPYAWAKVAGLFLGAGMLWKAVLQPLGERIGKATVGRLAGAISGSGGDVKGIEQTRDKKTGRFVKGQAFKGGARSFGQSAGIGAAVGMAAVGVGAGIALAAVGISKLADAMSKLTKEQADNLTSIVWAITGMVGIAAAATAALIAFGGAAAVTGPELVVFGAGVALIGGAIGIAAAGIGVMAGGMSMLVDSFKGIKGGELLSMAGGIVAMAGGLALFANPVTGIGLLAFSAVMGVISVASIAAAHVADSMASMGVALKGSAPDFLAVQNAIESISKANVSGGGVLADLVNLMKQPLKVKFDEKDMNFTSNISLQLDGEVIYRKVVKPRLSTIMGDSQSLKAGNAGGQKPAG